MADDHDADAGAVGALTARKTKAGAAAPAFFVLYRAVVAFDFSREAAFIKFMGTHAGYDRIDVLTIDQFGKE